MSKQEFSLPKLAALVPTEGDAYRFLEQLRWTDGTPDSCPHCEAAGKFYYLAPKDGLARVTRTGKVTQRRIWKCATCRRKFTVLIGTPMECTKISIRTWVMVIFEVVASKNSISAWEISRKYEITNESAWFLLHRIREAMQMDPVVGLLGGAVQVDEAWIGGDPKNRHADDPREVARKARPGRDGYAASDKQPVVALVHYETRSVHAVAVPDVTGASLLPAIEHVMDLKRTHLHTDGGSGYKNIASQFRAHEYVNHDAGQYARGNISTNLVEGFFSQLKRSVDGTHHSISTEHLNRYLVQFAFLYTHCRRTDSQRMRALVGNMTGRRLPYKVLIGATGA